MTEEETVEEPSVQDVYEHLLHELFSSGLNYVELLGLLAMLEAAVVKQSQHHSEQLQQRQQRGVESKERPSYLG